MGWDPSFNGLLAHFLIQKSSKRSRLTASKQQTHKLNQSTEMNKVLKSEWLIQNSPSCYQILFCKQIVNYIQWRWSWWLSSSSPCPSGGPPGPTTSNCRSRRRPWALWLKQASEINIQENRDHKIVMQIHIFKLSDFCIWFNLVKWRLYFSS